jgi:hypothetical protein
MRILHVEDDDTSHKQGRCRKNAAWRRLLKFFYLGLYRSNSSLTRAAKPQIIAMGWL